MKRTKCTTQEIKFARAFVELCDIERAAAVVKMRASNVAELLTDEGHPITRKVKELLEYRHLARQLIGRDYVEHELVQILVSPDERTSHRLGAAKLLLTESADTAGDFEEGIRKIMGSIKGE